MYAAVNWTHQKLDQKYPGCSTRCFMRRMGKIIWTDHGKMKKYCIGPRFRGTSYIEQLRNVYCIGHILGRNCLLKLIIEEQIQGRAEMTGRRRRRTQLLADVKERDSCRKPKQDALDRAFWRTHFGRRTSRKIDCVRVGCEVSR